MSRTQAESVIKNIIREIAQECAGRGQGVSETLVAFMVKAVVLDSANGFNVDKTLTKDDVEKLIKLCVSRLLDSQSASLATIKMQVYFDMNYTSRADFLEEHRRVLESRLSPVVREITDSRARTREELEGLYRKIVSCVLLRSGLGSPTDITVVREATAALQSVFPHTELGTFMSLTKRDKEKQLQELTQIVSGIRLFNRECGKGGDGIDDLPAILQEAIPATTSKVQAEIDQTVDMAFKFTAMVEHFTSKEELPEDISLVMVKDCLINLRQLETFYTVILQDVLDCARQTEALETQFKARMENLKNTVQSKTAVPTAQVYPQFINLSHVWTGFQDEMVLLSVLSNIQSSLDPFGKITSELFPDHILNSLLDGIDVKTDNDRLMERSRATLLVVPVLLQEETGMPREHLRRLVQSNSPTLFVRLIKTSADSNRIDPDRILRKDMEVLYPETTKNFDRLPILYRGFCVWSIVKNNGSIVPSNPAIGVLLYKNNYYAFSNKEAAYEFSQEPERYITDVASAAKKSPELIQLLELHAQFAAITPYQDQDSGRLIEAPITKCDSGTQTDTHFMESNIVKSYEWNEWELRRKAIKLANLRTRVTHSMQTDMSNYKRDNVTQVYLPKAVGTQTKREESTSVPKPSRYMAGLRGCNSTKTTITMVDLTLDVEQT